MFEKIRAGKLGLDTCFELGKLGFILSDRERNRIIDSAYEACIVLGYNKYTLALRYISAQLGALNPLEKRDRDKAEAYIDIYVHYQQNGYIKSSVLSDRFEEEIQKWKNVKS